jgi:hypothetical protein
MHLFDRFTLGYAGAHVGLVRCHNELKTRSVQPLYGVNRPWQQLKLAQRSWGNRFAIAKQRSAQHAIPVEKYRNR